MPDHPSPGQRRKRALKSGILTSVLSRAIAALTPLLVIPMGLGYLGATNYGAWAAALSLTTLTVFADLGIGNGLMTRLGMIQDDLNEEARTARKYIASGYAAVAAVCATLLTILVISTWFFDWAAILGVSGTPQTAVTWIIVITFGAFFINMVASLIVRVQYGLAQQARSNLWQAAGSLSTLVVTWLAVKVAPSPAIFVGIVSTPVIIVAAINTLTFFRFNPAGHTVRPTWADIDHKTARQLITLGVRFLLVSALMSVSIAIDPLIVARTSELSNVPEYAIPFRIFVFISTISAMLTIPLWPFHASAVQAGETIWISAITRRMTIATTLAVGAGALIALITGPHIVKEWIHPTFPADPVLWSGFAAWITVQAVAAPAFMVQNGAEILAPQTLGYLGMTLLIPVKWAASSLIGFQVIPWIAVIGYCILVWPACLAGYRATLRKSEGQRL